MPPAIARLRGDFIFRSEDGPGPHRPIDVSLASPDFIALRDVPPLFVRTLLLSEDAGFYGHSGIDLRELPSALLTNWSRGGAARGASTITQQLAKNLFLSRDKEVGRKLQELAITFLLESALGKDRILEIYLNIIEWGPGIHGADEAARFYFDRDAHDLTLDQSLFLATVIPSPSRWRGRFDAHGAARRYVKEQMHFIGRAMIAKGRLPPEALPPADSLRVELAGPAREILFPGTTRADSGATPAQL
jgi:membrane peptidoglycan carboxypeptidase